ncbi:MAG: hypothetical protein ABSC14_09110 [Desulfomonilia bacterium]
MIIKTPTTYYMTSGASEGFTVLNAFDGALMAAGMARTHVISGTLLRSWKMDPVQQGPDLYEWWVGPTVVYARRQELGFLPPHKDSLGREFPTAYGWPYVRPAYVETLPKIRTFINNAYRGAILGR